MSKTGSSIKARLRSVMMLTSGLVLIVIAAAFVWYQVGSYKHELVRDFTVLMDVVAANSAGALSKGNSTEAAAVLATLCAEPNVDGAALYRGDGSLLAAFPTKDAASFPAAPPRKAGHEFNKRSLTLFHPVNDHGNEVGTLCVRANLQAVTDKLQFYGKIVFLGVLGALLIAYGLSTVLQQQISSPIVALAETADAISSSHDYSTRAPRLSDDEVGVLTDAFNQMLDHVEQSDRALRESAQRFEAIFHQAAIGMAQVDLDGRPLLVNDRLCHLLCYSRDELLSRPVQAITHPEDLPKDLNLRQRLLAGDIDQVTREKRYLRKDGSAIWASVSMSLVRDSVSHQPQYFILVVEDIMARKKAEQSLRESEEKFRTMVETANEGIWILDPHARVSFVNEQMAVFLGYPKEEILGRPKSDFVFPADHAWMETLFQRRREGLSEQTDVRFRRNDGSEVWTIMSARALFSRSGEFQGSLDMFTDVTGRKKAEAALETANATIHQHAAELEKTVADRTQRLNETISELEAFSFSISHDMRAPLRAMHRYAEILLQDAGPKLKPEEENYIHQILTAARRLDQLIQDVLSYSRVARAEISLAPIDLEKLIPTIIEQYPQLQPENAAVEIHGPLLRVIGQEASLTQCLSNLLINAVKFVVPSVQPHVVIRTEAIDTQVRIWVEDNGIGIAAEDQQRIFGLFTRVHNEKKYEGTGIGLAIVRKAVERMGGSVGVESEPGRGSRFWLQLPRPKEK